MSDIEQIKAVATAAKPMSGLVGVGLSTSDSAPTLSALGPCLDRYETLDLDSVEIHLPSMEVVLDARINAPRLAELRRLTSDRPFAVTLHGAVSSDLGEPRHHQLQKDVCRACLEVCGEIGATVLVHHSTIMPYSTLAERQDWLKRERDALVQLGQTARSLGVVLAVETLFGGLRDWCCSPAELACQLTAVGDPYVRATIDFSHAWILSDKRRFDYVAEIAALAPLAGHLHIHDSFGKAQTFQPYIKQERAMFGQGDLHLPPGWGSAPWGTLAELDYGGPTIANLELDARYAADWPAAISWTREWIGRSQAARAAA